VPSQFKVDIFSETRRICDFSYKLYIIDKGIDELKNLADGKSKDARAAKLGLSLMKAKHVSIIKTSGEGHVDDLIVSAVKKGDVVATQDINLKRRVKRKGARIITMRQKKFLILQ
jgi:rRNA-processing protein FCF1